MIYTQKNALILSSAKLCILKRFFLLKLQKQFIDWGQKLVFRDEKVKKETKVKKKILQKLPEWFGPITNDPICFHKDGVFNQSKLIKKKS